MNMKPDCLLRHEAANLSLSCPVTALRQVGQCAKSCGTSYVLTGLFHQINNAMNCPAGLSARKIGLDFPLVASVSSPSPLSSSRGWYAP